MPDADRPSPSPAVALVVVGSLMMDLVIRTPRRPGPGETVFGSSFDLFLGGKRFNQAVGARRLGARVSMIGRVGDDEFGRTLRAALAREGVDETWLVTDQEIGTGVANPVIEEGTGENAILSVPRANMRLSPADVERAAPVFEGAAAILLQCEVLADASLAAARFGRRAGARVLLNTAPAVPIPAELLAIADILIANEIEAALHTGPPVGSVDEAHAAAARLRTRPDQVAIVTLGERGAVLDAPGLRLHLPAHPVRALDTTGAGDAFCAVFAVRLAETADLRDALAWGNAAGAAAVTVLGAEPSLPTRATLLERLSALPDNSCAR